MKLQDGRGIETPRWNPNEILSSEDLGFLSNINYQNTTNLLALLAATPSTPDAVLAGLLLEWSAVMTCYLRVGAGVSFTGAYLTGYTWSFAATAGNVFSAVLGQDTSVVFDTGSASDRYDTLQIRPTQTQYDSKGRNYKDPITGFITSALTATKLDFDVEVQILKGTPGAGVAPTHTVGWIKVAEVFVPALASAINQSNIKDVRDSATWTTEVGVTKARITAFAQTLLDDLTASESQTTLGISTFIKSLLDDADRVTAMATLGRGIVILATGSPYTLVANSYETFIINVTTNPYVVNLPQASSCVGYRFKIVNGSAAATGLIEIVPYTGDAIGKLAANVKVYLQNVDQSGMAFLYQHIELVATVSGEWAVVGGQFCPAQAVDTNGQQYHFGKLHHLPTGNTTSRQLLNAAPATAASWYASAISAAGTKGIPAGAKGIRVKVWFEIYGTAAGEAYLLLGFSDNNSSAPSTITSHPMAGAGAYVNAAAGKVHGVKEVDIPLDSSGNFYMYTYAATNVTVASTVVVIAAVGFYMGD